MGKAMVWQVVFLGVKQVHCWGGLMGVGMRVGYGDEVSIRWPFPYVCGLEGLDVCRTYLSLHGLWGWARWFGPEYWSQFKGLSFWVGGRQVFWTHNRLFICAAAPLGGLGAGLYARGRWGLVVVGVWRHDNQLGGVQGWRRSRKRILQIWIQPIISNRWRNSHAYVWS